MSIQTQFKKFNNKIRLGRNDDAYKKVRERDDSITKDVKAAFKEAGYPVVEAFMQGSLATMTGVMPLSGDYDIDRALVVDADDAPNGPVKPKITTLDVLEDRGFKNARIKMPCVTADYASENIHIDFVIYKKMGNQYYLAVGKKNSEESNRIWEHSDPKGLIDWVNDQSTYWFRPSEEQNQFRRLVRYVKRWRDQQFSTSITKKIFSIGLTVMIKKEFRHAFSSEGIPQDLVALRDTIDSILEGGYFKYESNDQYRVSVLLPKSPLRDIFDGSSLNTGTQLRNKFIKLKDKLIEADELDNVVEQAKILQTQFGNDFEVPDENGGKANFTRAIYPTAGVVGHRQGA